jgi:hypothetical protein
LNRTLGALVRVIGDDGLVKPVSVTTIWSSWLPGVLVVRVTSAERSIRAVVVAVARFEIAERPEMLKSVNGDGDGVL